MDIAHVVQKKHQVTLFQLVQKDLEESYPSLSQTDDPVWHDIIDLADIISLPSGTQLLHSETPCMQFMLLLKGCIRVYQQTANDREATLYRIHGGDICVLSLNGLIQKKDFGAFAKTETNISALSFSRELFMHAMSTSSAFREFILLNLTSRFDDVLNLMEEIVFENLDTRLICLLARLSRDNETAKIKITHKELAYELGSSREVISRLLKGLEKQGCIKLGRGVIQVLI